MSARQRQSGTTLLEMLIALAVMAMLAAVSAAVLGSVGRSMHRGVAAAEQGEIALARHGFRGWLEHALPYASGAGFAVRVEGDARHLAFNAVLDDGSFWPGAMTVVNLAVTGAGNDSVVSATAIGQSDADQLDLESAISLSGLGGRLDIRYFGRKAEQSPPQWYDHWQATDGIPALVRISISDGSASYPPLIIRPSRAYLQSEMSLSSLLPPALPSRP